MFASQLAWDGEPSGNSLFAESFLAALEEKESSYRRSFGT
jgi:hypothetical protein